MQFIIPIILILSSIGIFFGYVDPNYKSPSTRDENYAKYGIKALQEELNNYKSIANDSLKVLEKRDLLNSQVVNIPTDAQNKLKTLLHNNVDNIRLIIEVNNIAAKRGLKIRNTSFSEATQNTTSANNQSYGTLNFRFTVKGATYENFLQFLGDLETNLRLLDVTNISFTSTDSGLYDFNVGLNTYWLK